MSQAITLGRPSWFSVGPKKTHLVEEVALDVGRGSCFLSSFVEFRSAVSEEKSKLC